MSTCPINTTFKGVNNIGHDFLLNILESNFKIYFDWSFLNIGAWFDVEENDSTIFGINSHSQLLPVADNSFIDGQVWQGIRKDWIWETNFDFKESSPKIIDSVKVDGTTITKPGNFSINYPLGRLIFNNPINITSLVQLSYSYRFVQVYRSCDVPWFNIVQYSSFNTANSDINRSEDGDWSIGGHHRIQMPCIIVDAVARSRSLPYEIGNNNLIIEQDIICYVLAENKNDRNKILDILRLQQDGFLFLFDTNKLAQDEKYPLDYNGDIINNHLNYPNIVENYKWRKCWIKNVNLFEMDSMHPGLYQGAVRFTTEIISH
jgi:hypothetical protein